MLLREATADDVLAVARSDRYRFQRMALDLIRGEAKPDTRVRSLDLPQGRTDGGWDGVVDGQWGMLHGRIRVSVKGNLTWEQLRDDNRSDLRTHPQHPVVLVAALALDEGQRRTLQRQGQRPGVPGLEIIDGAELAEMLRRHALIDQTYRGNLRGPLWPAGEAIVNFVPRAPGRDSPGPWLPSELACARKVAHMVDSGRVVVLVSPPGRRADRVVWGATRLLMRARGCGQVVWADTAADSAPARGLHDAKAERPIIVVAPPGRNALHALAYSASLPGTSKGALVAIEPGQRDDAALIAARGGSWRVDFVELPQPQTEEARAWLGRLVPNLSQAQRAEVVGTYGRAPRHLEYAVSNPELLAADVASQFADATDRGVLGWLALVDGWSHSDDRLRVVADLAGLPPVQVGAIAETGRLRDWFTESYLPYGSGVFSVRSPALRWAILRVWLRDGTVVRQVMTALAELPQPLQTAALEGLALADMLARVEPFLFERLSGEDWGRKAEAASRLLGTTARLARRVLELTLTDLRRGKPVSYEVVAPAVAAVPQHPSNLELALDVLHALAASGYASTLGVQGPVDLAVEITNPANLRNPADGLLALEWAEEQLRAEEGRPELVGAIVRSWLAMQVRVERHSHWAFSIGGAAWNKSPPPALVRCWRTAGAIVEGLLADPRPERKAIAWELVSHVGEVGGGPARDREVVVPAELVQVLEGVVRAGVAALPSASSGFPARARAEDLLLQASERSWNPPLETAKEVLDALQMAPAFLMFRLCTSLYGGLVDPAEYLAVRAEGGAVKAREWRFGSRGTWGGGCDGEVVRRLVDTGADAEVLVHLLGEIAQAASADKRAHNRYEPLRSWAELDAKPFADVVLGDWWGTVPRSLRGGLLLACAPVLAQKLVDAGERASGAAADVGRFLSAAPQVDANSALQLIPAIEAATTPTAAMERLLPLAEHPDPYVRMSTAYRRETPDTRPGIA